MSYTKQNFIDGAVLTANNLNLMEDGIVSKQDVSNLTTTLDENSDDTHYPSAKAVYDFVDEHLDEINAILVTQDEVNNSIIDFQQRLEDGYITAGSADTALKSTQDASGNVITNTYETKADASAKLTNAKNYADAAVDTATEALQQSLVDGYITVDSATNATNDSAGNKITDTYATKSEVSSLEQDIVDSYPEMGYAIVKEAVMASEDDEGNIIRDTYQTKNDGTLTTTAKTIVGAINELNSREITDTTYDAAGTSLGLVKSGGDVTITDGVITVNDDSHNHTIANIDNLQSQLDGKSPTSHTHNYAGSSSAGGSATSAVKLDSSAGSATQPVYFSDGKPVATTYTLGASVPSGAKFTDTDTKNTAGTTNKTGTKLFLAGATSQAANPTTYSNSNVYIGTDNCLYSGGKKVATSDELGDISTALDSIITQTNSIIGGN